MTKIAKVKVKKVGRPTKKNPLTAEKIIELSRQGKTNEEIGEILGVSEGTVRFWVKSDYGLYTTVKALKQEADQLVEASLFKRANGYTVMTTEDKVTPDGRIVTCEIEKHIPPDPISLKFWLTNRQKKDWRDKVDHTIGDPNGDPLTLVIKDYRGEKK